MDCIDPINKTGYVFLMSSLWCIRPWLWPAVPFVCLDGSRQRELKREGEHGIMVRNIVLYCGVVCLKEEGKKAAELLQPQFSNHLPLYWRGLRRAIV